MLTVMKMRGVLQNSLLGVMQRLPSHLGAFKTAPHPSPCVLAMLLLCQAGAGVQALSTKQHNMQAGWPAAFSPSRHPLSSSSPSPAGPRGLQMLSSARQGECWGHAAAVEAAGKGQKLC